MKVLVFLLPLALVVAVPPTEPKNVKDRNSPPELDSPDNNPHIASSADSNAKCFPTFSSCNTSEECCTKCCDVIGGAGCIPIVNGETTDCFPNEVLATPIRGSHTVPPLKAGDEEIRRARKNAALKEYQFQLMLLEWQNKNKLFLAESRGGRFQALLDKLRTRMLKWFHERVACLMRRSRN